MQVNSGVPTHLIANKNGAFTFQLVYARRKDYESVLLVYTSEFSGDLCAWNVLTATPTVLADDGRMKWCPFPIRFPSPTKMPVSSA